MVDPTKSSETLEKFERSDFMFHLGSLRCPGLSLSLCSSFIKFEGVKCKSLSWQVTSHW